MCSERARENEEYPGCSNMRLNYGYLRNPPVVLPPYLRRGSILFAVVSVVLLGAALHQSPKPIQYHYSDIWQPFLMILWLAGASWLIEKAYSRANKFQRRSGRMLSDSESTELSDHTDWLESREAVITGILFAFLGLVITVLVDAAWHWKVVWSFVVCATFYYAGYGIWGAWTVTRAITALAAEASKKSTLNIYHGDNYCGLGFALKYADVATLFMLTGVSALPMAAMLVGVALKMENYRGTFVIISITLAILIWGFFSFVSTVGGRSAIAFAVSNYRDTLLDNIASKKRDLSKREEGEMSWNC